jgi:spermidine synthase
VAPFAARIRLVSKKKIGSIVGSLYALSTLGSITGTFLAGYFLIPTFGNSILLYILSLSLLILSCISVANIHRFHILTFIVFGVLFYMNVGLHLFRLNVLEDVDSLYNRIIVRNLNKGNVSLITLSTDNIGMQSSIDLLFPEKLNSDHNNAYRIGGLINRNIDKTLMLGGAGFTFPRYFLENNLGKSIDVVEIDPKMQELAKKYYFLKDDPRMRIFSTDARLFIKNCTDKYDVIYVDAFTSFNPPYHLTTVEFMTDLRSHLTENGILMVNMISAITGDKSEFLNVEGNTIKHVFGQVDLFVIKQSPSELIQNLILVAYNNERPKVIETSDKLLERLISKRYNLEDKISSNVLLTDDFAPVDYITRNFINVANK